MTVLVKSIVTLGLILIASLTVEAQMTNIVIVKTPKGVQVMEASYRELSEAIEGGTYVWSCLKSDIFLKLAEQEAAFQSLSPKKRGKHPFQLTYSENRVVKYAHYSESEFLLATSMPELCKQLGMTVFFRQL